MTSCTASHIQIVQRAPPTAQPGNPFKASMVDSAEQIACRPNSSCTQTLTRQLRMITHMATKPAFAPSVVVMMSSPDPTIEAERIIDGPRQESVPRNVGGGSRTATVGEFPLVDMIPSRWSLASRGSRTDVRRILGLYSR